jgi:hypothetical protein
MARNKILFGTSVMSTFKTHSIDLFALNARCGDQLGSSALFVLAEPLLRSIVAIVLCRCPVWVNNNGVQVARRECLFFCNSV